MPLFSFTYLPLLICLECQEDGELPSFLGSTLRGALGWALQKDKQVYYDLFENNHTSHSAAHTVNPYIIEPPKPKQKYKKGDKLFFSFILLGHATSWYQKIITILAERNKLELGARRLPFRIHRIFHGIDLSLIWQCEQPKLISAIDNAVDIFPEYQEGKRCAIQLQTPLRIRRKGKLVTQLDFATIIRNISKRIIELTERYGGHVDLKEVEDICLLAQAVSLSESLIYPYELKRYSTRRNKKMDFTGILGMLTFEGDLTPFIPLLNLAQLLHIGRNTTFGCGKIDITIV